MPSRLLRRLLCFCSSCWPSPLLEVWMLDTLSTFMLGLGILGMLAYGWQPMALFPFVLALLGLGGLLLCKFGFRS